jgi:hypothetical protein
VAKFNIYLKNHSSGSLVTIGDILQPLAAALAEAGHSVQYENTFFYNRPFVNLLVEFFEDNVFVDSILERKRSLGADFVFGVLVTEDIGDPSVMDNPSYPHRRENLRRVLAAADFVWSLVPIDDYRNFVPDPGRVAFLRFGYVHALAQKRRPGEQDIDVLVYGLPLPRRDQVLGALSSRGWAARSTFGVMPDYVRADMLRRSKVILDIRRAKWVRYNSPSRIVAGLHAGVAVVSERFDSGELSYLFGYVQADPYETIVQGCDALLRKDPIAFGLEAQRRFRLEAPMRAFLKQPLAVAGLSS